MEFGSCGRAGLMDRRTSRSARFSQARTTCTTSPSQGSEARCGGTLTSHGSELRFMAPLSSFPNSTSPIPSPPLIKKSSWSWVVALSSFIKHMMCLEYCSIAIS
ncbi:hypothetical protein BHE74_00054412, partial [Ensete ventricosum]